MGFKSVRPAGHAAALLPRSISWWNEGSLAPLSVHRRNTILIFQETWESEGHPSHMINNPGCLPRSYASTPSPSFSSRSALVTANSPYWLMLQLVKSPIPDTHGKTQCHRWITLLREEARPARHIYASPWVLWIIVQHFVSLQLLYCRCRFSFLLHYSLHWLRWLWQYEEPGMVSRPQFRWLKMLVYMHEEIDFCCNAFKIWVVFYLIIIILQ